MQTKKLHLVILLLFVCLSSTIQGQLNITSTVVPTGVGSALVACDTAKEFQINVTTTSACTSVTLTITSPHPGIVYQNLSVSGTNTLDPLFSITRTGGPDNAPVFTLSNLPTFSSVNIKYKLKALCSAVQYSRTNNLFNTIQFNYLVGSNPFV